MSTTETNVLSEDQKLLDALSETPVGTLPFELLKQLESRGSDVVPALIEILKKAITEIRGGHKPETDLHFFAFVLLGAIGDPAALPVMIEAISLPDKMLHQLVGDLIHDPLPPMIVKLSRGDVNVIRDLVTNRDIYVFVRWSVAGCYRYLVRDKVLSREEAAKELETLLNEEMQHPSYELNAGLAQELAYLAVPSSLEVVRRAYQSENVDEMVVTLEELEDDFADPATFEKELSKLHPADYDLVQELNSWASFQPQKTKPPKNKPILFPLPLKPAPRTIQAPLQVPAPRPNVASPMTIKGSEKYGRNDPCPCMSGKKYKKCCGANK